MTTPARRPLQGGSRPRLTLALALGVLCYLSTLASSFFVAPPSLPHAVRSSQQQQQQQLQQHGYANRAYIRVCV